MTKDLTIPRLGRSGVSDVLWGLPRLKSRGYQFKKGKTPIAGETHKADVEASVDRVLKKLKAVHRDFVNVSTVAAIIIKPG